jgi:hypothetical protein
MIKRNYTVAQREANKARSKMRRLNNPNYDSDQKRLKRYKLTPQKTLKLFHKQKGLCLFCKQPMDLKSKIRGDRVAVDHDHSCCKGRVTCGKCVNGLAHELCNFLMGFQPGQIKNLKIGINNLIESSHNLHDNSKHI